MTSDTRLREALLDLADVSPPADLAGAALDRARRHRRRTLAGVVATVAVLAAVAITVPVLALRPRDRAAAAAAPRLVVTAYALRDPDRPTGGLGRYTLYDRSIGSYEQARWPVAVPSPDGRTIAVMSAGGRIGVVPADRMEDPAAVRWGPHRTAGGSPVWSPDGRQLYVPDPTRSHRPNGFPIPQTLTGLVIDPATLSARTVELQAWFIGESGRVVFAPGGAGFAMVFSDGAAPPGTLWVGDGSGTRTILTVRPMDLPDQPFPPAGGYIAGYRDGRTTVVDLVSGAEVASVPGAVVGWYDDKRLVVRTGNLVRVMEFRTGRVLAERQLGPDGSLVTGAWLAPLHGTPPPGAVVL